MLRGPEPRRLPVTVLAAQIGWERSRVSHHVRRMTARGLVTCGLSESAYANIIDQGSLPPPVDWHPPED
jgi:DNA-binding IclR family transcriptional regulator